MPRRDVPCFFVMLKTIVLFVTLVAACSRQETSPDPTEAQSSGVSGPARPSTGVREQALDALKAIRLHYELAGKVNGADWDTAGCRDTTVGYEALMACERRAMLKIASLNAQLPATSTSQFACGLEIERRAREYVAAVVDHHTAYVKWLDASRGRLTRPMSSRSLREACRKSRTLCSGEPILDASLYELNSVQCTTKLFTCLPGNNNTCWINKIADRLADPRPGQLLVKATGEIVD